MHNEDNKDPMYSIASSRLMTACKKSIYWHDARAKFGLVIYELLSSTLRKHEQLFNKKLIKN